MKATFKSITIEDVEKVWGNANFGPQLNADKMAVIKDSLLKHAAGCSTGHTAFCIMCDLGLITRQRKLTLKGRRQLWAFFGEGVAKV